MATKNATNYKAANIKVLMLGASRVGKTSILATMVNELFCKRATEGSDLELAVTDTTEFEHIKESERSMINFFEPSIEIPGVKGTVDRNLLSKFPLNTNPNDREIDFTIPLKVKGKKEAYTIGFTDIPGEWVNKCMGAIDTEAKKQLHTLVGGADVLMVAIDSVLIMEENGINAKAGNKINELYHLFKDYCKGGEDNGYKMVIFVPVKCEKYFNQHLEKLAGSPAYEEDPMEVLIEKIEEQYKEIFEYLSASEQRPFFDVAILPVLTLGNIIFRTFDRSESAAPAGLRTAKDMLFGYYKKQVVAGDDGHLEIKERTQIPPHEPRYCEQPLALILLYELEKIKKIKDSRSKLAGLLDWFGRFFKGMSKDDELLAAAPFIRKNLAMDGEGYVSKIVQDPITKINIKK